MRRVAIAIFAGLALLSGCRSDDPLSAAVRRGDLAAVQAEVRRAYPDVPTIKTVELQAMLSGPVEGRPVVLDVRAVEEFSVSHLPGAVRDTGDDAILPPEPTPIVLYCSVGVRSSIRARELMQSGRRNVRQLDGSIFRWAIERRPMVDAAGRHAERVHPYDSHWGRLLPGELNSELAR